MSLTTEECTRILTMLETVGSQRDRARIVGVSTVQFSDVTRKLALTYVDQEQAELDVPQHEKMDTW